MTKHTRLIIAVIGLALASLACDLSVSGPAAPGSPIPVSTEAAGQVPELWKAAATNAANQQLSVTITEEQLTSFVAIKLQDNPDAPVKDIQVFLRDGKIQIFGKAQGGSVNTTALIVIAVSVTPEGTALFTVEQADFGPLPVPSSLLEGLSSTLNEAFTGQVGSVASGFRVTSITIADGQMAITGTVTR
jgi:hypothetical protein